MSHKELCERMLTFLRGGLTQTGGSSGIRRSVLDETVLEAWERSFKIPDGDEQRASALTAKDADVIVLALTNELAIRQLCALGESSEAIASALAAVRPFATPAQQPAIYPCGCSKHKVNFGKCDSYKPGELPDHTWSVE